MIFPMDDLKPGDVERALKALDESTNGRNLPIEIPNTYCLGCRFFRIDECSDGPCHQCLERNTYWGVAT